MISTYNAYHLGDNLVHLHFMRKLAASYPDEGFVHYASPHHVAQLKPLVEDMPNLKLLDFCPLDAINAWRGADDFWQLHEHRKDFVLFHLDWFRHLAGKMGLASPIHCVEDMQFDYPALAIELREEYEAHGQFDVLLINSIPHSGQFRGYNTHDFENMARALTERGKKVITTFPTGVCESTHDGASDLSVTGIGRLSRSAKAIVGVVTGPSWPCYNVWNREKLFVNILDEETVNIMPNTQSVRNCAEAMQFL